MFSKAKRFVPTDKNQTSEAKKSDPEAVKLKCKFTPSPAILKPKQTQSIPSKYNVDTQSQCSSTKSVKSFVTPKPVKNIPLLRTPSSLKKQSGGKSQEKPLKPAIEKVSDDIIKSQEVEIRNKDFTISEYSKQIEELKYQIANLQKQSKENLITQMSEIHISDNTDSQKNKNQYIATVEDMQIKIKYLEKQCEQLEQESCAKQVELLSLEEMICVRDGLCKDLQDKLSKSETSLDETKQRLEMVKGHHALALEANESIRREYRAELEAMKGKLEEEKQAIMSKCKSDQEAIRAKHLAAVEIIKEQFTKEKDEIVNELEQQIINKETEMKAKLEQVDEATNEKIKLCEIQFEERCRSIQEHWTLQEKKIQYMEKEILDLKYTLNVNEDRNNILQKELDSIRKENENLQTEKCNLTKEVDDLKDESKKKFIDFENEVNKLTVEVDKAYKEKNRFEMSLSVTRDIVHVLTMRLRESDDDVEHLEGTVQTLTNAKELLEQELASYRSSFNNTVMECNEYKEALVNILKSKAVLAKEHTRIMEHNVSLIESLQNVEKEAFRELGTIKNELIEDVELLKKESTSQIEMLRDEVEKKRLMCELATEHAGQAAAAAGQARELLAQAARELARLEDDNLRLTRQIHDQQSLVVELSLLRQEHEALTATSSRQAALIERLKRDAAAVPDKLKKDAEKPKSPAVIRKSKIGKENSPLISPLRERNH